MSGIEDQEIRAGSQVLALLATPLNTKVLRAHGEGPRRFAELQSALSWSAESTLRSALTALCQVGGLTKRQVGSSSQGAATQLTEAGEEMLSVADVLQAWLADSPNGPIILDSDAGRGTVKALAGGWSSASIRALASAPQTLIELSRVIPEVSYPALERRLAKMRNTGLVEPVPGGGRGTSYAVTPWLRSAIAPLCAAGRCERRHLPESSVSISHVEVEAAFMLALPLLATPRSVSGDFLLAAQAGSPTSMDGEPSVIGVTVQVQEGEIIDFEAGIDMEASTWVLGTPDTWLDGIIDGRLERIRFGGAQADLARMMIERIHQRLFPQRPGE